VHHNHPATTVKYHRQQIFEQAKEFWVLIETLNALRPRLVFLISATKPYHHTLLHVASHTVEEYIASSLESFTPHTLPSKSTNPTKYTYTINTTDYTRPKNLPCPRYPLPQPQPHPLHQFTNTPRPQPTPRQNKRAPLRSYGHTLSTRRLNIIAV
jgi:hypothetical protein